MQERSLSTKREKRKQPGLSDFSPDLNNRIVQDYYVNLILFSVTALFLLAFEHLRWREWMDIRTNWPSGKTKKKMSTTLRDCWFMAYAHRSWNSYFELFALEVDNCWVLSSTISQQIEAFYWKGQHDKSLHEMLKSCQKFNWIDLLSGDTECISE